MGEAFSPVTFSIMSWTVPVHYRELWGGRGGALQMLCVPKNSLGLLSSLYQAIKEISGTTRWLPLDAGKSHSQLSLKQVVEFLGVAILRLILSRWLTVRSQQPVLIEYLLMSTGMLSEERMSCWSHCIHPIDKTLLLEKYKPWTVEPNVLMGITLLALQI